MIFLTVFGQISITVLKSFFLEVKAIMQLKNLSVDVSLLTVAFRPVDFDLYKVS